MNKDNIPPQIVISGIEKKMDTLHTQTSANFNKLADILIKKNDSSTGQIYFKTDLIQHEIATMKAIIEGLAHNINSGFKILNDYVIELNKKIDHLNPPEKQKTVKKPTK